MGFWWVFPFWDFPWRQLVNIELVLGDLQRRFGAQLVLYPADLALIFGESEKALTNLMSRNALPFEVKWLGGRRCVDIYQIARWLAEDDAAPKPEVDDTLVANAGTRAIPAPKKFGQASIPAPARSKMADQIIRMRHEQASSLSQFNAIYHSKHERLFILEVIEALLFGKRLPPSQFVITRSSSTPLTNGGVVNETKWLFDNLDDAVNRTRKAWAERFEIIAFRLILREGRRVLFRGHVVRNRAEILIDLVGCVEELTDQ